MLSPTPLAVTPSVLCLGLLVAEAIGEETLNTPPGFETCVAMGRATRKPRHSDRGERNIMWSQAGARAGDQGVVSVLPGRSPSKIPVCFSNFLNIDIPVNPLSFFLWWCQMGWARAVRCVLLLLTVGGTESLLHMASPLVLGTRHCAVHWTFWTCRLALSWLWHWNPCRWPSETWTSLLLTRVSCARL
jgi:hypothetical protein